MTAQLETGGERVILETWSGALAGLRSGEPGAPAVVLLPGYTGSKEDFAPVMSPLAHAGFAVTAIDLPGQFESAGPADPAAYTPQALGVVVRDVAAAVGPRVHLVGHSFGGLVARAAVIAEPEAFLSLVLMGSGPAGIGGARRDLIDHLEPVLAVSGMAAAYDAGLEASRAQAGYVEPPAALAAFLRRRFVASAPAMLQGMGDALRTELDRVAELAAVELAMLVLHGVDDDAWSPSVQSDMARRLDVDRVVIGGAAHSPAVENPSATAAALIDFWRHCDH